MMEDYLDKLLTIQLRGFARAEVVVETVAVEPGTSDADSEKMLSWLHLTDLHWGHGRHQDYWPTIKNAFFSDLRRMTSDICKATPDVLLFTGDITFAANPVEFEGAWAFFDELRKTMSWKNFRLIAVPGNHDVTRPNDACAIATHLWLTNGLRPNEGDRYDFFDQLWTHSRKGTISRCFYSIIR